MHCYKATYSMAVLVSTDELKIRKKKKKEENTHHLQWVNFPPCSVSVCNILSPHG